MSLHDLLDDVARTAPPADARRSAETAWATAVRRRSRTRFLLGAAVVGLVTLAVLAGISLDRPAPEPLPGNGQLGPGQGIPAQIYALKPWLPTIGDDPIPPIVYVVEQSYLDRPVAISVDGSYRYLPGPPGDEGYTLSSYALSKDGRHVAMAWSGVGQRWTGSPVHAQVLAYDVTTGERTGPWLGHGFAGEITDLVWRPDNQGFAWQERRQVGTQPDPSTESVVVVATHWEHYQVDVKGAEGPVAWSPDGTQLVVSRIDGPHAAIIDLPAGTGRVLDAPAGTVLGSGAWTPDGSRLAGLHVRTNQVDLVLVDTHLAIGGVEARPLGEDIGDVVLGWRGDTIVFAKIGQPDLAVLTVDPASGTPVGPPLSTGVGKRANERLSAALGLLDSAPVVRTPPPAQPRLSWTYLRTRPVELVLLGLLVLVAGLTVVTVTRRRRRRPALGR